MSTFAVSAAILAGGQSTRMGTNKAFVRIGGRPIIERIILRLRPLADDLVIITNTPETYAYLSLPMFADLLPGKATLGGVYTAISQTQAEHTLIVSCDQPFLNPELLRYIVGLRAGFDVVIPLDREGYPQSMHALYGKHCLEPIRRRLDADQLKVIGFLSDVHVREVSDEEINRFDPDRYSFFNVNTPEDAAEANRLASQIDSGPRP